MSTEEDVRDWLNARANEILVRHRAFICCEIKIGNGPTMSVSILAKDASGEWQVGIGDDLAEAEESLAKKIKTVAQAAAEKRAQARALLTDAERIEKLAEVAS